jgi:hypothetical protein
MRTAMGSGGIQLDRVSGPELPRDGSGRRPGDPARNGFQEVFGSLLCEGSRRRSRLLRGVPGDARRWAQRSAVRPGGQPRRRGMGHGCSAVGLATDSR